MLRDEIREKINYMKGPKTKNKIAVKRIKAKIKIKNKLE
jgi:hypothetical protein